jgi:hypothetical protein
MGEPGLLFVDYIPHLVPQSTRSSGNRVWVDDSSTSTSALKKSCPPSTQISGSMLLGERILILPFCFYSHFLSDSLVCSDGNVVELLEGEEENDSAALITRR